ncbi:MAG: hypothetical protein IIZ19_09920, partial [Clostridia bacterium]|nr:hypothetical protein [Clostridia bacterium]
ENDFFKDMLSKSKKAIEDAVSKQLSRPMKVEFTAGKKKTAPRPKKAAPPEPDPLDLISDYDENSNVSFDDI